MSRERLYMSRKREICMTQKKMEIKLTFHDADDCVERFIQIQNVGHTQRNAWSPMGANLFRSLLIRIIPNRRGEIVGVRKRTDAT